ncbi:MULTISPECIES: serine/threonine-protein kinase [unclassified Pseudomonas]|uniref:serine/threonine-protein kinase n=1 Tax=unclassified Pseudomonas TaxID=196821 RepID=UPI00128B1065|nr:MULTISPECIES: serine/threonine-protein kinase [unclassified Pseudomonas]MPQ71091.1 protein kinase [Pseudomonas sp. MWU12-2323]
MSDDLLAGRYRLEQLLGAGGMSTVYRALDLLRESLGDPDPYVAVKRMSDSLCRYPDANALLHSEFALTLRLHHPHVVRVHDYDIDEVSDRAFITMELLRGQPVDRLLIERPEGLPWDELQTIALALLDAVAYCHDQGLVHGDLKPSNLMLTDKGLKVFDFGLSQSRHEQLQGLPRLQRERFMACTRAYAAPELLEGGSPTRETDLYAVACVLYELACGRLPFPSPEPGQTLNPKRNRTLKPAEQLPPFCWSALCKALAFKPAARRIDAHELRDAFQSPAHGWLRC